MTLEEEKVQNTHCEGKPSEKKYHLEVIDNNQLNGRGPTQEQINQRVDGDRARKYHRLRSEIMSEILRASVKGESKRQIMSKVNLSYTAATNYLEHLIRIGLLHHPVGTSRYSPTERGLQSLTIYDEMTMLLNKGTNLQRTAIANEAKISL